MSTSSAAAPAPRPSSRLLADRTFGPWFWGNVVSNSGNWLFNVTAAAVVYQLTGSALLVGLVSVAQYGPMLVLAPVAGALSDRVDRRRLLLAAQAFAATAAGLLGIVALAIGIERFPGAWPILLAALGTGLGLAVSAPALNSLVPALVDDVDLESAVSLTSLTFNVGRALGPAASGALLATLGPEVAFAANGASFLVFIAALLCIRVRPPVRERASDGSVRAGLRYVRSERQVALLLVAVAGTGFAADPMITLAPPLAAAVGGGETLVAVLVSAFGVAAAPAAVLSGRLQRRLGGLPVAGVGAGFLVAGLLVAAVAPGPAVAVSGFAATGVGFVLALTSLTTALQRRVPDALRGRVMALWSVAFLGNRPLAAAVDGAAADLVGPRWAMGVAVTVAMATGVVALRLHRRGEGRSSGAADAR